MDRSFLRAVSSSLFVLPPGSCACSGSSATSFRSKRHRRWEPSVVGPVRDLHSRGLGIPGLPDRTARKKACRSVNWKQAKEAIEGPARLHPVPLRRSRPVPQMRIALGEGLLDSGTITQSEFDNDQGQGPRRLIRRACVPHPRRRIGGGSALSWCWVARRSTAVAGRPAGSAPVTRSRWNLVSESVQEGAATAQDLDHAGRDRAIRGQLAGDDPTDVRTRGKGELYRAVPARHVKGRAGHPDQRLGGTEAAPRRRSPAGWPPPAAGRRCGGPWSSSPG